MAVNASESIQSTRDLAHHEKNSTDLAGSRAAYHDLDDFEKSIHNSFSMLMEYRDVPRSPSTSSVTSVSASGLDALSSPTTPASPIQEDMDDKLPNELLEEICEDMGIKDSMDIDLIDYMMDQTNQMNNMQGNENYYNSDSSHQVPRMPEIPLNMKGSGLPGGSMGKENMQQMINPNFQSTNNGSSLSCMPGKMINSGKPLNSFMGKNVNSQPHAHSNLEFKAPCAPTQLASSVTSNISKHSNYHQIPNNQQQSLQGNCMHSYSLMSSITRGCCGGTHDHYPNCPRSSECSGIAQQPVTFAGYPPNIPNHNLTPEKYFENRTMNSGHMSGKLDMYLPYNSAYTQNKYGRPSPPVVNVQNMKMSNSPHFKFQSGCLHQTIRPMTNCSTRMFKYDEQQLVQKGRTLESPLDQGYFSGDAASVKSFSSQSSICQSNDMLSSQDSLTIKNEQSPRALYNRSDRTSNQVTVKTENMLPPGRLSQNSGEHISHVKQYISSQPSNVACNPSFISCQTQNNPQSNIPQHGCIVNAACASDTSQKSVQSKILPRLTHSKDVAPYTVPSNNGQATINPYHEFTQGATTAAQTGLDNTATAVDFPTNFGKESLNAEQQNQCQGMYSPEYCKQGNADCLMVNSDPHSHPSSIHTQQSPNLSYSNFNSHNSDIVQTVSHPAGHSVPAYSGIRLQKGINNSYHFRNNSDAGTCSVIPNQMTSSIKSFKPNLDNRTFNINRHQYMHETCLMGGSNLITAQTWPPQEEYSSINLNNASTLSQQQQNAHYMCPRNSVQQSSTSQHIQTSIQSPPFSNLMPHNIEMRNQAIIDLASNQIQSGPHQNILNDNMPQINPQSCWPTSLGSAGAGNQVSQAINSMQNIPLPPQAKIPKAGLQHMQFPPHPIGDSVSSNCKLSHRPPMLSSQEAFIEHLIMDKSSAYRSHPLFPLLRDLMITYMNFNSQSIHYQLIQHLPSQFERLLQNFLNRNPPRGDYQSNYAVESVIMDALRYAHSSLIEKIRSKQEQDKRIKGASQSITAIEEFCEKFDRSKHGSTLETGACIHGNPTTGGQPCSNQVFCRNTFLNDSNKNSRLSMEVLKEQPDSISDTGSVVSSSSNHSTKSESKKHPSLPKEAVAVMLEWLRNHKDNPYPNDDEKAMLIKQTGLTINQINYWFTNARRRILPKWAQAQAQPQPSGSTNSQTPIQLPGHQVQLQHASSQMQQQQNSQSSSLTLSAPSSSTSISSALTSSTVLSSTSCSSNSSSITNDDNNSNNCQKSHLSSQQQQTKASVKKNSCLINTQVNKSTPPSSAGKSPEESVTEEDRLSKVSVPPLSE